jgi:hypothetical protein
MANQRKYLLDANVFIQASRQYYGFETCPGFWESLIKQHENNRVFSIKSIKAEITKGNDALKQWIESEAPDTFFKDNQDQLVSDCFKKIIQWVQEKSQYQQEAIAEFASVADGWLIAYAKTYKLVVVTHETSESTRKNKVKIPDICQEFNVEYIDTFQMLRELGIKFGLKK